MKEKKVSGLIASIIFSMIGIAVVNAVILWRQYTSGVILTTWNDILWAVNLSMIVQILGNFMLLFYRTAGSYLLVQAIQTTAALISIIVFYAVFPIDFSQISLGWLNILLKALIIVSIVGSIVGIAVFITRLINAMTYKEE